jgi:hypothetical protein
VPQDARLTHFFLIAGPRLCRGSGTAATPPTPRASSSPIGSPQLFYCLLHLDTTCQRLAAWGRIPSPPWHPQQPSLLRNCHPCIAPDRTLWAPSCVIRELPLIRELLCTAPRVRSEPARGQVRPPGHCLRTHKMCRRWRRGAAFDLARRRRLAGRAYTPRAPCAPLLVDRGG